MTSPLHIPPGQTRTSTQLLGTGLTKARLRQALRCDLVARPFRDTYVQPDTLEDVEAMARIALSVLTREAVIGRQTAAHLHGLLRAAATPGHVMLPNGATARHRRLLAPHIATWSTSDVTTIAGIPCTGSDRTVVDLARTLPAGQALAVVDAALRSWRCSPASLLPELERHRHQRGVVAARRVVSLGDPRAESPMESILRLVMIDGGLPAPVPQFWVEQAHARIYLALPPWRVAVEFASRQHHEGWERVRADKSRDRRLVSCGWVVLHFTAPDVLRHPEQVVAQIRAAMRRQGWSG